MTDHQRYAVISSDCHGGANLLDYRDYLDSSYHEEFDRWAAAYEIPYEDLKGEDGNRNWDSERRLKELEEDGVVAEVLFPNTIPPFFAASSLGSQRASESRQDLDRRWAGLQAHNRWLADFCAQAEGRRSGVFQIMLYDVDQAVREIRWAVEAGLRGGLLLPGTPPGSGLPPLYYHERYDDLWRTCAELGVPINCHSGSAAPRTGDRPEDHVFFMLDLRWWDQRTLRHLILGGVLERHPGLRVVFTEEGLGWIPAQLKAMDDFCRSMRADSSGELSHGAQVAGNLSLLPSEYWTRQCYVGASFMHPSETAIRERIGVGQIMWGSDYPHVEASYPYSREAISFSYAGVPEAEVERMLGGTAAELFGFDMGLLQPIAERVGPLRRQVAQGIDPADLPDGVVKCPAFAGVVPGSAQSRWADNRKGQAGS
jgi:predicted TIM-barrel fold metal-dependent hydrolase